ncbi:hypothetical protein ACFLQI_01885 [Candidatus Undinarchaeota archaeon]
MKELVYVDIGIVVVGMLIGSIWNETVMMFFFLLGLCLLSRYPKVAIVDGFIVIDMVDFFTFYVAYHLGFIYAIGMILLGTWMPQAYSIGESPIEGIVRTISLFVGLGAYYVTVYFAMSLLMSITIAIGVAMLTWAGISIFVIGIPDPRFVLIAVAKPIFFNRVLGILGCC